MKIVYTISALFVAIALIVTALWFAIKQTTNLVEAIYSFLACELKQLFDRSSEPSSKVDSKSISRIFEDVEEEPVEDIPEVSEVTKVACETNDPEDEVSVPTTLCLPESREHWHAVPSLDDILGRNHRQKQQLQFVVEENLVAAKQQIKQQIRKLENCIAAAHREIATLKNQIDEKVVCEVQNAKEQIIDITHEVMELPLLPPGWKKLKIKKIKSLIEQINRIQPKTITNYRSKALTKQQLIDKIIVAYGS